ncbi:MAG: geranylgeranyl pyrophosphate synthase [Gammaproteobacteria bacterium]|jgi:geranylgeranyl diphosphate synthase type II|nr:geranylgeranyl pyrophosphate synthase [Gammaproteobacteria bacterium]
MDGMRRIDQALETAVGRAAASPAPPKLARALRHAVFPGGARVRPQLCLAVAGACGDDTPALSDAAAAAIELLHCASLVHDDLPCFDDADLRRGQPTVHVEYGEPLAVLVGDALIVMAFETLAMAGAAAPQRLPGLVATMSRAAGAPTGLVAGQAWESEPCAVLSEYQRAKTGALFVAATMAGASAAGADPGPWRSLGDRLGEAYQVADDIRDAVADAEELGKPVGRDASLERPSAVGELGVDGAVARLHRYLGEAVDAIPDCPGHGALKDIVLLQAKRLTPKALAQTAA